jgi:hypothetical protein
MKRKFILLIISIAFLNCANSQVNNQSQCFSVSQMLDKSEKDSLLVTSECDVLDFKIEIYNRWGEVLFTAYQVGKIDIFKEESGTQIQATKKKVKRKSVPVLNPFSEGQYTWITSYYDISDLDRKDQKSQNGYLYITE